MKKRHRNGEIWEFERVNAAAGEASDVILGLDGGTTSTVCICMPISDGHAVLNHNSVAEAAARETLERVMADALSKSGSDRAAVRAVCLAVPGVNHQTDRQRILDWLSGYGIAARALTAVINVHDGRGSHTMLTSRILQKLDLSSSDELIGWTYADPSWARIAALVPVVISCAEAGDEVANKFLYNSVEELASSVKTVVQRLGLCGEEGKDSVPLVMVGGVFEANRSWDIGKEVIKCISKEYPGAVAIRPQVEPAVGAALELLPERMLKRKL